MTKKKHPVSQFRSDITALITEVEACLRATPKNRDREFNYQHEAFRERCMQAKKLTGRFEPMNNSEWSIRSGDARRIREALKLSLAYFRGHPLS
ncbi:MAG: hypothetical protein QGH93_03585 [Gammaproteobacteria bacterium]|jgi:hypothetical protein|nr:hypothetical protein [Chromatiales bacterium]MDP6673919.1 hypothetical protein [Gammaproteobacteria bacterium]